MGGRTSKDQGFTLPGRDLLQPRKAELSSEAARTSPLVTGDALDVLGSDGFPQRALYGHVISQHTTASCDQPINPTLYINTNAPFSALICGVQGSGKSHSTAVLLEGCLIQDTRIGSLPAPLSGLVFYMDTAAGSGTVQPCEAAYLAAMDAERAGDSSPPGVTVLVLPRNLQVMKQVYAGLPNVEVEPLYFHSEDISGERLLTMMRLDENLQLPIYMEAIMDILRSMEHNFNYRVFCKKLGQLKLKSDQRTMLDLRLTLLDSCIRDGYPRGAVSTHFKKGHLTIIDMSSPFMDSESACGFFDLVLGLFVEADLQGASRLVVLDEAHKYLSNSKAGTSGRLTESVLAIVRQQRHLGTRVVISTQEPTVVPSKFLDLSSFIITHQFSSPAWMNHLSQHVSSGEGTMNELLNKIVALDPGEAIVFAPRGLVKRDDPASSSPDAATEPEASQEEDIGTLAHIGQGYLHVKSRRRITRDGGHAVLAVPDRKSTRLGRVSTRVAPKTGEKGTVAERAMALAREKSQATAGSSSRDPAFRVRDYVVNRFTVNGASRLSMDNIRKALHDLGDTEIESGLREAQRDALLRRQGDVILPPLKLSDPPAPPVAETRKGVPPDTELIDYVKDRLQRGVTKLSFRNIRKQFAALDEAALTATLTKASKAGDFVVKLEDGNKWVVPPPKTPETPKQPSPSTTQATMSYSTLAAVGAAAATAISLKHNHLRFRPLVRFVLESHAEKGKAISVESILQHFLASNPRLYGKNLKELQQVVSEAISEGLLVTTHEKDKAVATVAPVPGAKYDLSAPLPRS